MTPVLLPKNETRQLRGGYPVRHNLFYKRVFRPTIEGDPDNGTQPALPARLQALRWHDLRHTCAALSLSTPEANLATVKERLGHENIATTVDLYGKRVPSVDAALADAVGASIFAPPKVVPINPAQDEPPAAFAAIQT